jgi:hypothetical protein
MPMTANTMSAMVMAGLNNSNKRLLEVKMVNKIPCYSTIYIYSFSCLNGFGVKRTLEDWKTEMLFRREKSELSEARF